MGIQEEHDQITSGGKGEQQVKNMKAQAEEFKEFYKKLKDKNDHHKKSIVGLTTEMVEVKKRIRLLLNKPKEAAGPDYDEYKITRKISKSYEPIDPSRSKVQAAAMKASIDLKNESLSAVSVTVAVEEENPGHDEAPEPEE